uniref:SpaC n=1 Tax=Spirochaeta aurantia TaxID=147 RepID=Q0PI05_SPIAU|nr:SpaC [Spirochaeta aurantia]
MTRFQGLFRQLVGFGLLSGIGWVLDFSVFLAISVTLGGSVWLANGVAGLCGATFVYFTSAKWTFGQSTPRLPWKSYSLYLAYQVVAIVAFSLLAETIFQALRSEVLGSRLPEVHDKVISKIVVTPFSMGMNFLVMRRLTKKE